MVFCSVYEITDLFTTTRKQHMWCWFDGKCLQARWTTTNFAGCSTFQMNDVIDGGFEIVTGSSTNNGGDIAYNDINHYDDDSSTHLAVIKADGSSASVDVMQGVSNIRTLAGHYSLVGVKDSISMCNFSNVTRDGATASGTATCVALDTVFHLHQLVLNACNNEYTIDGGCVDLTDTTNLPSLILQPSFLIITRTNGIKTGAVRYMESFNR